MQFAVANPTGAKPKRTKKLGRKRRRKNAWFGERERHSLAKLTGKAGPVYKSRKRTTSPKRRKKKRNPAELALLSNPHNRNQKGGTMKRKARKKTTRRRRTKRSNPAVHRVRSIRRTRGTRRRHRNPGGANYSEMGKSVLGGVVGFLGAKFIGHQGANLIPLPEDSAIKQYVKPGLEIATALGIGLFGEKLIKDKAIVTGAFVGASIAAVQDTAKALAPGALEFINDAIGENEDVSLDDIVRLNGLEKLNGLQQLQDGEEELTPSERLLMNDGEDEDLSQAEEDSLSGFEQLSLGEQMAGEDIEAY